MLFGFIKKIFCMKIREIIATISDFAPEYLKETYDNVGLLVGNPDSEATAALLTIDVTEAVVDEAISLGCNLIITHHPIMFRGIKQLHGRNEEERLLIKVIKHDIAIYAAHTNLDNAYLGVSFKMAEKLNLQNIKPLKSIDCEQKNGSGVVGFLEQKIDEISFLTQLKKCFQCDQIRHTKLLEKPIQKIALCGGSGAEFIDFAKQENADIYITGDLKYHDFFKAENSILLVDIGHFESEQYTKEIFYTIIREMFPQLEVQVTKVNTNPIKYM